MKSNLENILDEMLQLLAECELFEKAEWFKKKKELITDLKEDTPELKNELEMLKRVLAGMGSFSDLPMIPKAGSKLTEDDAEKLQQKLTERLYQEIKKHS